MEVYSLIDDIRGETYRNFIAYCLEHSTFFSFTCYHTGENKDFLFIKDIQDYFYKSFQTNIWYYHKVYEGKLTIRLYDSDISLVDFFVKQFGSIFHHQSKGVEDICFFDDKQVLFASITHEKFAELFPSSQIDQIEVQKFSKWKKRVLVSKDYEFLPDFQKFL